MLLQNISINRIIIHQVFRRDEDGNRVPPFQSHEYTNFTSSAMDAFKNRIVSALGHESKAVRMEIVNQEANYLPALVDQMVCQDRESFAVSSYDIANMLTNAQQYKHIPGGIIVIFDGDQDGDQKKFIGIIKAEIHSGYEKIVDPDTNEISLKFIEELLLTPGTRLYKAAGFFQRSVRSQSSDDLNDKWIVMVSDNQISKVDGKVAAQYFYADFLGCGYPQTSARTTKQFYESTKAFINNMDITQENKIDLYNALSNYLRLETSSTINASEFAARYFDIDTQDSFTNHIMQSGLPSTSFTKDIEHIKSKLKQRKLRFKNNVKITAPPDVFEEMIEIETIDGDLDESETPTEWTKIIVKDRIYEQE